MRHLDQELDSDLVLQLARVERVVRLLPVTGCNLWEACERRGCNARVERVVRTASGGERRLQDCRERCGIIIALILTHQRSDLDSSAMFTSSSDPSSLSSSSSSPSRRVVACADAACAAAMTALALACHRA